MRFLNLILLGEAIFTKLTSIFHPIYYLEDGASRDAHRGTISLVFFFVFQASAVSPYIYTRKIQLKLYPITCADRWNKYKEVNYRWRQCVADENCYNTIRPSAFFTVVRNIYL